MSVAFSSLCNNISDDGFLKKAMQKQIRKVSLSVCVCVFLLDQTSVSRLAPAEVNTVV